jgi:hypothetical protein
MSASKKRRQDEYDYDDESDKKYQSKHRENRHHKYDDDFYSDEDLDPELEYYIKKMK